MITLLLETYRRLDRIQRTRRFHVVASVLVVVLAGAAFGALLNASYGLDRQRRALVDALGDQNLNERDVNAVSLAETGTVTVDGVTYGGEMFRRNADLLFDDDGAIRAPAALAERLLRDVRPTWAPAWMLDQPRLTWLLAAITIALLLLIVWLDITVPFLLVLLGTAIPVVPCWLLGARAVALALGGVGLLTFTYVVLTRAALLVLRWPVQVLAVAHTVVKEASRSRISLVFIMLLLVILPLLPLWLDPDSPLRFQIQTFISRSMTATFALSACLTLFLSCATVAFEIRDRQIWQIVTKPVGRAHYLMGKWLGVITVNLILLTVSGVSTFTFVQYLRERPVASGLEGQIDALAVQSEVLTARRERFPSYQLLDDRQLAARTEQLVDAAGEYASIDDVPLSVLREMRDEIQRQFLTGQRTIPPLGMRDYTFRGLDEARARGGTVTLRYRFYILRSDPHETFDAVFAFNGDPNLTVRRTYVPSIAHVLPVPASFIQPDGTLTVSIFNSYEPTPDKPGMGSINFEVEDFQVLYTVGGFEMNFVRAVLINWIKLSFLAMLGVCASTFLSFPVACLLSFTVFAAGTLGPFLADALTTWYPPSTDALEGGGVGMYVRWAFDWTIKGVAEGLVWSLSAFGEISATQRLVDGRYIGWGEVGRSFAKLGVLWSGAALVTGWIVIRSRQLAIYSGHG